MVLKFSFSQAITKDCNLLIRAARYRSLVYKYSLAGSYQFINKDSWGLEFDVDCMLLLIKFINK